MCYRKVRLESHVSESDFEPLGDVLVNLDGSVPDNVLEGQEVPEKEPDDGKQDKKNEKTKKAKKTSTPDLVEDKNDRIVTLIKEEEMIVLLPKNPMHHRRKGGGHRNSPQKPQRRPQKGQPHLGQPEASMRLNM